MSHVRITEGLATPVVNPDGTWLSGISSDFVTRLADWDALNNVPVVVSATGTAGDWHYVAVGNPSLTIDSIVNPSQGDLVYFKNGIWNLKASNPTTTGTPPDVFKATEPNILVQGEILSAEHTAILPQDTTSGTLITVGAKGANKISVTNNSGAVIEVNVGVDVIRAAPGSDLTHDVLIVAGAVITITPRNAGLTTADTVIINVTNS